MRNTNLRSVDIVRRMRKSSGARVLSLREAQRYTRDQDCAGWLCYTTFPGWLDLGHKDDWTGKSCDIFCSRNWKLIYNSVLQLHPAFG
jgi:hypothetical protein